jgi:hypothetical protein
LALRIICLGGASLLSRPNNWQHCRYAMWI